MNYQVLPPTPQPVHSFGERLVGALKLERPIFDEVRRDPSAMMQAAAIIAVAGFASGVGAFFGNQEQTFTIDDRTYHLGGSMLTGLLAGLFNIVFALITWVVLSLVYRFVATKILHSTETSIMWQEVARPIGFASAPSLLALLTPIPILGPLLSFIGGIWAFAAQIVALSETFRVSKWRAFAIILVTGLFAGLLLSVIGCVCILAILAVS